MDETVEVSGIEMNPIFAIATEADAWTLAKTDYIIGTTIQALLDRLKPGEHLYLVQRSAGQPARLTDLTTDRRGDR